SHELRTPMTSVRAFSEILRDEPGLTAAEQHKYASIIHDEALRLTRLLNDLLDLSVLESGAVSLNVSTRRLGDVLDHALSSALAGADGPLQIIRDRDREAVEVETDVDRLSQVFINLIANAQKYCTATDPELRIHVRSNGDRVEVDLADNGAGIPVDFHEMIFEKFSRVTPERAGGAGLGLAICKEIMRKLGGDISFLSEQEGAAFRVTLPIRLKIEEIR
ncbi:MAG: HAMP domain-containing histidine kinase, partial [Tritonibacter mobilis]|nr:HAMP domain-containing histidine kinase [Tritonibacter mobilis]